MFIKLYLKCWLQLMLTVWYPTSSLWPLSVLICLSVCMSHTFSVPSAEADTKYLLSSDRTTAFTSLLCACTPEPESSCRLGWPVRRLQTTRSPLRSPVTASSRGRITVQSVLASNLNKHGSVTSWWVWFMSNTTNSAWLSNELLNPNTQYRSLWSKFVP